MRREYHYSILPGEGGNFMTFHLSLGEGLSDVTKTCCFHGKHGEGSLAFVF